MLRGIKFLLFVIFAFFLINLVTLLSFGKTALAKKVLEDTHTSFDEFRWTSDVNLLSDFDFDEGQIEIFQIFYKYSHADLNYIYFESFEDIREFALEKGKYVHLLLIDDFLVWPIYKVDESEKIDEYYHGYRRTYLWLIFKWVKIEEDFSGIS